MKKRPTSEKGVSHTSQSRSASQMRETDSLRLELGNPAGYAGVRISLPPDRVDFHLDTSVTQTPFLYPAFCYCLFMHLY
ncbi:hypothetical protein BaRGS_00024080 [Batillaria attramentaria]|uniref:Uncharacterized protein n=1 Tax=Batillaria attramentaria TaxID=370345 RepID=A0ABD0KCJ0_9CAEN